IRRSSENVKQAVVIGGGFIGMEVAAVLAQKGIRVTMVLHDERIWKRFFSPQMSEFFESYYSDRDIRCMKSTTIRKLRGKCVVRELVTVGGQIVPCEMVVAGIGVTPVIEMLANNGLELQDGVMVNEYLQTQRSDIYAAGD